MMTKKEFTKVLFTKPVEPWYKNNSTSNNKFSVTWLIKVSLVTWLIIIPPGLLKNI
jgi:hypothetical protein